jgi:hypothetical protein
VDELAAATTQNWITFFHNKPIEILPLFTLPGTLDERIQAFINHLLNFFTVPSSAQPPKIATPDGFPILHMPTNDYPGIFIFLYQRIYIWLTP